MANRLRQGLGSVLFRKDSLTAVIIVLAVMGRAAVSDAESAEAGFLFSPDSVHLGQATVIVSENDSRSVPPEFTATAFATVAPPEVTADPVATWADPVPTAEVPPFSTVAATASPVTTPTPVPTAPSCPAISWPTDAEVDASLPTELALVLSAAGSEEPKVCQDDDSVCVAEDLFAEQLIDKLVGEDYESESHETHDIAALSEREGGSGLTVESISKWYAVYDRLDVGDETVVDHEQQYLTPYESPETTPDPLETPGTTPSRLFYQRPTEEKPLEKKKEDDRKGAKRCDQKKDEWGCFCLYSPPGGPYNDHEKRFADACLNAMGDPKQPDRWKNWYDCKEIKSFPMKRGKDGTIFEGLEEWIKKISADGVKCFRGFMYSHSNGYKDFVKDRTQPIEQCIRSGNGVQCFSLHDCGCSTAKNSATICARAKEISKALKNANSTMVVHFDAANEDQALPGGLQQVDKSKICAGNPDGWVVDEFFWRRAYITKDGVWIYRHDKQKDGTSKWVWIKYKPDEFEAYCKGNDPFTIRPRR